MRILPRFRTLLLLPVLAACDGDPWAEWPQTGVALSDLEVTRVAWDQGRTAEPGPGGNARYSWQVDIQNTSTTIWSGRIQIIAELEAGGALVADTLSDQVVIPGGRLITAANFGGIPSGASLDGLMPRFRVRIGAWCATIHGATGEAAPCPEEPAAAEEAPTDVGPPIG